MNWPYCRPGSLGFNSRLSRFRGRLAAVESGLPPSSFHWYPYDTLANLNHVCDLVQPAGAAVWEAAKTGGILDAGCGDGDLAFFFESLGYPVCAVDYPGTNYNAMQGVRLLKRTLRSSVTVEPLDLDGPFVLPGQSFGLVTFLGTLYHLKNPFFALEEFARRSRYLILSTRTAGQEARGETAAEEAPVAYLLDRSELNRDDTNYWLFTESALLRLLKRTGWRVMRHMILTDSRTPDAAFAADRRAFVIAASERSAATVDLLAGWHDPEGQGWRWTGRAFTALKAAGCPRAARIVMRLYVPSQLLEINPAITLRAAANGVELLPETYTQPGECTYSRTLPKPAEADEELVLTFAVDHAIPPDGSDYRERGIIVAHIALE